MDRQYIIPNVISQPRWEEIFVVILDYCDKFNVIFPDGNYSEDNPLMGGKLDFEKLEGILLKKFDGMKESIFLSGELTSEAKGVFELLVSPSFNGENPDLWWFKLYKNDALIMTIEDFTVCILECHIEPLLLSKGIHIEM